MSDQLDGFHFGIFTPDAFEAREGAILDGFGRLSGHVEAYPHGLAVAALKEASRCGWPADGEYVVVGVRLRDHVVVVQRAWVKRGEARREALVICTTDDEEMIEGDLMAARA